MFNERAQRPPFAWQTVCRSAIAFEKLGHPSVSGSGDRARPFRSKAPACAIDIVWSSDMPLQGLPICLDRGRSLRLNLAGSSRSNKGYFRIYLARAQESLSFALTAASWPRIAGCLTDRARGQGFQGHGPLPGPSGPAPDRSRSPPREGPRGPGGDRLRPG